MSPRAFVGMHAESLSRVQLLCNPEELQPAPLSMGFSRQEYWSGSPFPIPGDLLKTGIKPVSPALAVGFFTTAPPGKPLRKGSDNMLGFGGHTDSCHSYSTLLL